MSMTSAAIGRRGRPIGPPGVYVEDRAPVGSGTPRELMTGVPAFIGFTDQDPSVCERGGALPVVLDRWDVDTFNQSVKPAKDSFLHMAVRGFFANGGKRCVVLPVSRKPAEGQQDS